MGARLGDLVVPLPLGDPARGVRQALDGLHHRGGDLVGEEAHHQDDQEVDDEHAHHHGEHGREGLVEGDLDQQERAALGQAPRAAHHPHAGGVGVVADRLAGAVAPVADSKIRSSSSSAGLIDAHVVAEGVAGC